MADFSSISGKHQYAGIIDHDRNIPSNPGQKTESVDIPTVQVDPNHQRFDQITSTKPQVKAGLFATTDQEAEFFKDIINNLQKDRDIGEALRLAAHISPKMVHQVLGAFETIIGDDLHPDSYRDFIIPAYAAVLSTTSETTLTRIVADLKNIGLEITPEDIETILKTASEVSAKRTLELATIFADEGSFSEYGVLDQLGLTYYSTAVKNELNAFVDDPLQMISAVDNLKELSAGVVSAELEQVFSQKIGQAIAYAANEGGVSRVGYAGNALSFAVMVFSDQHLADVLGYLRISLGITGDELVAAFASSSVDFITDPAALTSLAHGAQLALNNGQMSDEDYRDLNFDGQILAATRMLDNENDRLIATVQGIEGTYPNRSKGVSYLEEDGIQLQDFEPSLPRNVREVDKEVKAREKIAFSK